MEVILLERVEKLGQMGEVVNVKPGYARNFLLPQKKALRATKHNLSHFDTQRAQLEAVNLQRREEAESVAAQVQELTVVIVRQASDSDQLYGSVTTRDIAQAVTQGGVSVDKRQVQLDRPIKTVGLHEVRIVLHPEVFLQVTANVARSEDEAVSQARGESVSAAEENEVLAEAEALFEEGQAPEMQAGDETGVEGEPAETEPESAPNAEED